MAIQETTHTMVEAVPLEDTSTANLVREAIAEAKELVRVEVALAREEAITDLNRVKRAAIGVGIAAVSMILVLSLLGVALVLALGGTAITALVVALGALIVAAAGAGIAYSLVPKQPMARTRSRLLRDALQLKEHVS